MQTKLTLRLDDSLIHKAKRYSHESGKSLSQLVADYFSAIESPPKPDRREISPRVKALRGIIAGSRVSEKDYRRHLESKHR